MSPMAPLPMVTPAPGQVGVTHGEATIPIIATPQMDAAIVLEVDDDSEVRHFRSPTSKFRLPYRSHNFLAESLAPPFNRLPATISDT